MENSSMSSASEYRPKDFNEMIGQDAIVKTLSNAIDSQKIPQALLFCGPRGVGKTSCARILAKKINDLDENFEYKLSYKFICHCLTILESYFCRYRSRVYSIYIPACRFDISTVPIWRSRWSTVNSFSLKASE